MFFKMEILEKFQHVKQEYGMMMKVKVTPKYQMKSAKSESATEVECIEEDAADINSIVTNEGVQEIDNETEEP